DGSGEAGWQVVQRGITYTVTVKECSIDDPKDGSGEHDSTFCKDAGEKDWKEAGGTKDSQPADLKRVTVDVKWVAKGRSPDVHQVATLTAAGESVGLSASSPELTSPHVEMPTKPVIVNEPKSLVFTATAPSGT